MSTTSPLRPSQYLAGAFTLPFAICGGLLALSSAAGLRLDLPCPMRQLADRPCPFCGTTRTASTLLRRGPSIAIQMNPWAVAAIAVIGVTAVATAWHWFAGRRLIPVWASRSTLALLVLSFGFHWREELTSPT